MTSFVPPAKVSVFPVVPAVAVLTGCAGVLLAVAWGATSHLESSLSSSWGFSAVVYGAVVAWGSILLGLGPVRVMSRRGVDATTVGYFGGMAGRLVVCGVAALIGVKVLSFDSTALLLSLAWFYIPLMFVEAGLVGRYLFNQNNLKAPKNIGYQGHCEGDVRAGPDLLLGAVNHNGGPSPAALETGGMG